jgi:hypothetical protein
MRQSSMQATLDDLFDLLVVPEQTVLVLADLDRAAAKLGDQDLVAGLHADGNAVARLVECAGAHSEHLGLVQLLDGCLGQEDAGCGLGLGLEALHEHTVEEGREGADGLEGRLRYG